MNQSTFNNQRIKIKWIVELGFLLINYFFKSLRPKQGMLNMADKSHFCVQKINLRCLTDSSVYKILFYRKLTVFQRCWNDANQTKKFLIFTRGFPAGLFCIYARERSWVTTTTKQGRNDLLLQFSLLGHSIIYKSRRFFLFFFLIFLFIAYNHFNFQTLSQ